MDKIIQCPFCGYNNCRITTRRKGKARRVGEYIQVICNSCLARGPLFSYRYDTKQGVPFDVASETEQTAIEAWNGRI